MRILQLGKFYPVFGGVEKVMFDLMKGLSERQVDCDMLCASAEEEACMIEINEHAHLIGCHTWVKAYATMISPSMIMTLKKKCNEYDIIHVHHPDPMACLALFLSGYKGKVVLHWHADIEKQKVLLQFYRPLQEWLLKRADLIVGTTPTYLTESPHLKQVQAKTMHLPIGIEPVCPDAKKVEAIRKRYEGKKIIFALGRLVAYKGFENLIRAAVHLSDDYMVLIGGDGPLMYKLLSEVETWGLQEKVALLGRVQDEDLPSYYGACDIFCLPSVQKTEAFGIVQIEAMSCGKPVVATNIKGSGVAWVNMHGFSGRNVPVREPQALAEAIMEIAGDEETYHTYSRNAEARYRQAFTSEQMIDNVLKIYNELWKKAK